MNHFEKETTVKKMLFLIMEKIVLLKVLWMIMVMIIEYSTAVTIMEDVIAEISLQEGEEIRGTITRTTKMILVRTTSQ